MADFHRPEGWPIVEPGLFMDHIGSVLVVYVDVRCSDKSFDRELVELSRAIDLRQWRVGVLYHVPTLRAFDANRRKKFAEMLDSRKEQLAKTTAAYALVTNSTLVRGLLRAVFWVAPPPYPHRVVPTTRDGFDYIASHLPGVSGDVLDEKYALLLKRYGVCLPAAPTVAA